MASLYQRFKDGVTRLLKIPPEPEDPMGDHARLKVFNASPNYYRYKLLGFKIGTAVSGVVFGVMAAAMVIAGLHIGSWGFLLLPAGLLLLAILVVSAVFNYVKIRLDYETRWYKLTDRSLRVREGVVNVHEMTMTFDNIQNISVNQGPLQRYFNIADVQVDSAGGGGAGQSQQAGSIFNMHQVFFRGVDNAEEIRQLILDRLKRLKTSGLGDADEDAPTDDAPSSDADVAAILKEIRQEAALFRRAAERSGAGAHGRTADAIEQSPGG